MMTSATTTPPRLPHHRLYPRDDDYNNGLPQQSILLDDSWRSLTPQPKTNAIPASPFEAQIFHRMVEHLQEEQLNQSMQGIGIGAANHHLPDVQEMDDSVSWNEHEILEERYPTSSTPMGTTLPTVFLTPPRNINNNNNHDELARGIVAFHNTTDEEDALHNEVIEAELALSHNVDDDDEEEEDEDEEEENEDTANSWEWSLHHPKLSKFPDIGPHVGSMEIMMMGDLVQKKNRAATTKKEESQATTWNVFGNTSIRLVHLEPSGRMISGRIYHGTKMNEWA